VLIGGGAEPAIRRAARLADGLFANAPPDQFLREVGWALDECERIGRDPATFRFIHYAVLLPGAARIETLERYRDELWAMQWKYSDMEASATRPLPPPAAPAYEREVEHMVRGRATFAGPPEVIIESLLDIRARAGVPVEFVARSHLSLLELDRQVELMTRLAEDVAPHV
jgi:alkanesulfonate monooxygenase SsuD/methylene tetrahydromethanopterin reductase-like flavin-dependent oxidoreductase (luciferase family)